MPVGERSPEANENRYSWCSVPEISCLNSIAESPGSQGASDLSKVGERGERSETG